ncbi:glycerol dehydrogenase [Dehalobacter sp. DCM]|uniref:glycerol dehydrogenase n=1 Tax=Dehalobacter sp. DCM TaxID=2907827 RepID=UPI00308201AD|nr:glycerol dehydrogenase [Dehalobacter sp. DCM]
MGKHTSVFIAPSRYVQGRDAIHEIGDHIYQMGDRALVVGCEFGLGATREGREKSFKKNNIFQVEEVFRGETSDAEIDRLMTVAKENHCNIMIATGGGKAIDAMKAAAANLKLPIIVVPTTASTDAPCSALAVIYNEDGTFNRLMRLAANPNLVLVDTSIIAKAPLRFLVSGMGDALATWFEADACNQSATLNMSGGRISAAALALARLCFDILMEYGLQAKIACENKVVTPALEKVVEANTILSGAGFESGGVASAHALSEGLTHIEEMHSFMHGEKVAFCTLTQLVLEGRPKETLQQVFDFCHKVGLPITLGDLNSDGISREKLMKAADEAALPDRNSHHHSFPVTAEMLCDAMMTVDSMGKRVKAGLPII